MPLDIEMLLLAIKTNPIENNFGRGFEKAKSLSLKDNEILLLAKMAFIRSTGIYGAICEDESFRLEGDQKISIFIENILKADFSMQFFNENTNKIYAFAKKNDAEFISLSPKRIMAFYAMYKIKTSIDEQYASVREQTTQYIAQIESFISNTEVQKLQSIVSPINFDNLSIDRKLYCYFLLRQAFIDKIDALWNDSENNTSAFKATIRMLDIQLETLEKYIKASPISTDYSTEEKAKISIIITERKLYAKTNEAVISLYDNASSKEKTEIAIGVKTSIHTEHEELTPATLTNSSKNHTLASSTVDLFKYIRRHVVDQNKTASSLQYCCTRIRNIAERPCLVPNSKIKNLLFLIGTLFIGGFIYLAATHKNRSSFWLESSTRHMVEKLSKQAKKFEKTKRSHPRLPCSV